MTRVHELPISLIAKPNIPWSEQTVEQLRDEMAHWERAVRDAPGFTSAKAADDFRRGCEAELRRRGVSA